MPPDRAVAIPLSLDLVSPKASAAATTPNCAVGNVAVGHDDLAGLLTRLLD